VRGRVLADLVLERSKRRKEHCLELLEVFAKRCYKFLHEAIKDVVDLLVDAMWDDILWRHL
jgi:hypothetical protein